MDVLKLEKVNKSYGDVHALKGFSYEFKPGIYGILGANGAGKSTLFNLLTDNLVKDNGSIEYNGSDIVSLKDKYREIIGYMPQQQGYYEKMTAMAYMKYVAYLKGIKLKDAKEQIENNLKTMNLWDVRFRRIGGFSGGMKQRLIICATLLGNPKILIFDEPTAGLDPKERIVIRNYISNISADKIILLATHIVSDIECIADAVIIMKKGEIVAKGVPSELIENVSDKVWEIKCDAAGLEKLQEKYKRTNVRQGRDGLYVKVVLDEAPENGMPSDYSNLEDVYMYYCGD